MLILKHATSSRLQLNHAAGVTTTEVSDFVVVVRILNRSRHSGLELLTGLATRLLLDEVAVRFQ